MRRKLFSKLYDHIGRREYTILTGARQVGKSTLLKQLKDQTVADGMDTAFLNLEQKDILFDLNKNPKNLLSYVNPNNNRTIVFIDEIQYLQDPSNFIKLIYDEYSDKIKLVATGSSAFYIDHKFTDSLAGRKRVFNLPTCSFDEYLELSENDVILREYLRIVDNENSKTTMLSELERAFEDYIIYGGYPAVATESNYNEKIALLKDLRDSYLHRDIMESGVKDEEAFYKLYIILASQTGGMVNVNELSNTIGISCETINRYLYILKKSFQISTLQPFTGNIRKALTKMPKVYMMDTGMRNCLLNYFPDKLGLMDDGALFETFIYHALLENYSKDDIKFFRTTDKKEIDFIIDGINVKKAIEVKYNANSIKHSKYRSFIESNPDYQFGFIYKEPFSEDVIRTIFRGAD